MEVLRVRHEVKVKAGAVGDVQKGNCALKVEVSAAFYVPDAVYFT